MASHTLPSTLGNPARNVRRWPSYVSAQLGRFYVSCRNKVKQSRQLGELYRLPDRDLHDMGLSRSDFPAIAKGTFRRDGT
jgi:uncharacterized protein YjiS (DUF1127 family)